MVVSGTLTTRAKGQEGWEKSASEWVGCARVEVGRAVLPEMKESWGKGPR
jgi:hypothetical protein